MKTGIELIADERQRQIEEEGWTSEHDDAHSKGELAEASACYAASNRGFEQGSQDEHSRPRPIPPDGWPWSRHWWKPNTEGSIDGRIKELAKAGSLAAAEIDRLQRLKKLANGLGDGLNRTYNYFKGD